MVADTADIIRIVEEGQGIPIKPLSRSSRNRKGSGGVKFGKGRADLRKKASVVTTVRSGGPVVVAVIDVDGKRVPGGLGSQELGIVEERERGRLVTAHLRRCGRSENSSSRAVRSRAKRAVISIA